MKSEVVYKALFILSFICMLGIRILSQRKAREHGGKVTISEKSPSLIAGAMAALVTWVFGAEYIFFQGAFPWAYAVSYPAIVRWLGAIILAVGITLLGLAQYHLGKSFHSLIVKKENQEMVQSGPYRWIRHPIYTAYVLNYLGGGLLAGNLILTIVPPLFFCILVALRVEREEQAMVEQFGQAYSNYMKQSGRFLPRLRSGT